MVSKREILELIKPSTCLPNISENLKPLSLNVERISFFMLSSQVIWIFTLNKFSLEFLISTNNCRNVSKWVSFSIILLVLLSYKPLASISIIALSSSFSASKRGTACMLITTFVLGREQILNNQPLLTLNG